MSSALAPMITATARWLTTAYPSSNGGAFSRALVEAQATQAVTAAALLRYPTTVDADLVLIAGPGGSGRLDTLVSGVATAPEDEVQVWRTWVDEVVASWAACLLGDPALAATAVDALITDHRSASPAQFRRLTEPGGRELGAATLLRHPDLLAPVADLHRDRLREALDVDTSNAA